MLRVRSILEWMLAILAALFGVGYIASALNGMVVKGQIGMLVAGLSFLVGSIVLLPVLWRRVRNTRLQTIRYVAAITFIGAGVFSPGPTTMAVSLPGA